MESPARFTVEQIAFIKHAMVEKCQEFWEVEAQDIIDTIEFEPLNRLKITNAK